MSFRLFGFEVHVRGSFLLSALLLGGGLSFLGGGSFDAIHIRALMIWIPVLFVSILVHELGHAFAIRWQKLPAEIQIHGMGGTTTWREILPVSRGARIVISLAGPFAGFAFGAIVFGAGQVAAMTGHPLVFTPPDAGFLGRLVGVPLSLPGLAYTDLIYINFIWGFVNLLPVLPFDGGHVLQYALGPKRLRATLIISGVAGGAACIYFLSQKNIWAAYLFGSSAVSAIIALRGFIPAPRPKSAPPPSGVAAALTRAQSALDEDRPGDALGIVAEILGDRATPGERAKALSIGVWAHLMRGEEAAASEKLTELRSMGDPDPALVGNVALACGQLTEARATLEQAYTTGDRRKEVFGPLIQALLRLDAFEAAARIALDRMDGLSADDCRRIAELVAEGGATRDAAKLLERLAERDRHPEDFLAAIRAWLRAGDRRRASDLRDSPRIRGTATERALRDDAELATLFESTS
ncbi:MAG: hypothetical protein U0414_43110 [Polyangiaceae bacterium]